MPSKVDLKVDDFVEQNKIVHNPCSAYSVTCERCTVHSSLQPIHVYHDFVLVMLTNALDVFALNGIFLYWMKYEFNKFLYEASNEESVTLAPTHNGVVTIVQSVHTWDLISPS